MADEKLKTWRQGITQVQLELDVVSDALRDAEAAALILAESGSTECLQTLGEDVRFRAGEHGAVRVESSLGITAFDVHMLSISDLLVLGSRVWQGSDPRAHLKRGLLWYAEFRKSGEPEALAQVELELGAADAAGVEGAKRCLAVARMTRSDRRVSNARSLLESASRSLRTQDWTTAKQRFLRLQSEYGDLPFVIAKSSTIAEGLAEASKQLHKRGAGQ